LSFLDYADTAEAAFVDAGGRWAKAAPFFRSGLKSFHPDGCPESGGQCYDLKIFSPKK
jgi:hypothetical protein